MVQSSQGLCFLKIMWKSDWNVGLSWQTLGSPDPALAAAPFPNSYLLWFYAKGLVWKVLKCTERLWTVGKGAEIRSHGLLGTSKVHLPKAILHRKGCVVHDILLVGQEHMTESLTGIWQQGLCTAQQSSHGSMKQHWSNWDWKKCQEINNYKGGVFYPHFFLSKSF